MAGAGAGGTFPEFPMTGRDSSERGLALIIVIVVLLALVLIATPFVLSMLLQEKGATSEKEQRQADYGADGARNLAIWQMMRGHDAMERRFSPLPWNTYTYDTLAEFQTRLTPTLSTNEIANPQGNIWGITIQDEQGKIDLNSAPQRLVDRFN